MEYWTDTPSRTDRMQVGSLAQKISSSDARLRHFSEGFFRIADIAKPLPKPDVVCTQTHNVAGHPFAAFDQTRREPELITTGYRCTNASRYRLDRKGGLWPASP